MFIHFRDYIYIYEHRLQVAVAVGYNGVRQGVFLWCIQKGMPKKGHGTGSSLLSHWHSLYRQQIPFLGKSVSLFLPRKES